MPKVTNPYDSSLTPKTPVGGLTTSDLIHVALFNIRILRELSSMGENEAVDYLLEDAYVCLEDAGKQLRGAFEIHTQNLEAAKNSCYDGPVLP